MVAIIFFARQDSYLGSRGSNLTGSCCCMNMKRACIGLVVVLGAVGLSACEDPGTFPVRKSGAKCSPVGAFGRDSTYVLQCKENKRWKRIMPIDQARGLIAAFAAQQAAAATPPPPPPPAPAPPLSSFGAGAFAVGPGSNQLPVGRYMTTANSGRCAISVRDAGNVELGFQRSFAGLMFVDIESSARRVETAGPCVWSPASSAAQPYAFTGMARVGLDVATGWYTASGGPQCYWEISEDADGSYGGVLDAHYGAGRVAISLTPTSGVLLTEDCGTWTRLASEPPRYFEVIGSPTDPILLGGREAFFTGYSPPALSGTASAIMITAGPWTLDLKAPTGSNFIAGTQYNAVTLNESATTVGMYLRGLGRSCTNVSGSLRVLALETSGGSVTRFSALARQTCDGVGAAYMVIDWDPVELVPVLP